MVAKLIDQIGVEHVAIGSDCARGWDDEFVGWLRNGRWQPKGAQPASWPAWPAWFSGPAQFPALVEGLCEAGLEDKAVDAVLGGNWMRLFEQVFAGTETT